jgi:L-fuculokinase
MRELVSVIDVGKSNAKLSFVDARTGLTIWSAKRANEIVWTQGLRQLDIVAIERWLLDAFKGAPHKDQVSAIVPIAHGAAAVLIDDRGEILAAPDYEDPIFATVTDDYERARDAFASTYSPSLPLGLNLGRQWHYLERERSHLFARVAYCLLYPQYWAWRFSGVMASEVTSLGCHSDLWRPREKTFSGLVHERRWERLLPPLRCAEDTLGTITTEVVQATKLNPACRVSCGMHDSNASFLQHVLGGGRKARFCAISSGTWTVTMAYLTDLTRLRPERDMLANVDAFSSPVSTARFMGGREYDVIAQSAASPLRVALEGVLQQQSMALPSFAPGGPFPSAKGTLLRADKLNIAERAALATVYVALMSDMSIDLLGAGGNIFVDGPLAFNPLFASVLAALRPECRVFVTGRFDSSDSAVVFLGGFPHRADALPPASEPLSLAGLDEYRRAWREKLPPDATAVALGAPGLPAVIESRP